MTQYLTLQMVMALRMVVHFPKLFHRRVEKIEIGSALKIKKRKPYQLVHFLYLTEKVRQVVLLVI